MNGGRSSGTELYYRILHEEVVRTRLEEEHGGYEAGRLVYILPVKGGLQPSGYEYVIYLNSFNAFGDGRHPTTALCVEMIGETIGRLEAAARGSIVMLDAGTGTGILAIVASLMGVGRIDAADIVPESVENARYNAKENGCENIDIRLSDIASIEGGMEYDFIAANLLPSVIFPNIDRLRGLLADGGSLMVSGIGDRSSDEAEKAFERSGLEVARHTRRDGWNCYLLTGRPFARA